ncbi:MAG TPA: transglycosylase SLT domain-containing protein [Gemmatimonadaceae bacterium]|nr:transglycosylase SLT domain-containing protein [Gemmatimonadaceae bacterium]
MIGRASVGVGMLLAIGAAGIAGAQGKRDADRYDQTFRKYSKRYFGVGYDWRVFKAQAMAESEMNPNAKSWVGARGLMQLMPSTYKDISSRASGFGSIDDPEWNIAAGIMHDRSLWRRWERDSIDVDRREFMVASYNAGEGTIMNAQRACVERSLDQRSWRNVETVAPNVPRWRYRETLGYVRKIRSGMESLDEKGRVKKSGNRE